VTPDQAVDLPYGVCTRIMMMRSYANTRSYIESVEDKSKIKHSPFTDRVLETMAAVGIEAHQAELRARRNG